MVLEKCPLCDSERLRHLRYVRDEDFFERNNIRNLTRKFEFVRCLKCRMVFVKDLFDHSLIGTRDAFDVNLHETIPSPAIRHMFLFGMINWVQRRMKLHDPKILEIGCGFGELYRLCKSHGFDYYAIEPSSYRTQVIRNSGLSVYETTVDQFFYENENMKFDIILLDNVIEHIVNPASIIEKLQCNISPGAHLIIGVPNLHDIRNFIIPRWAEKKRWPSHHVNHFTPKTLEYLYRKYGYELLSPFYITPSVSFCLQTYFLLRLSLVKYLNFYPVSIYMCGRKR